MKDFCENQYCDNPGAKVVPVSVERASDQQRTLCVTCEETYSWGVQHGRITSVPKKVWVLHVTDAGTAVHTGVFRRKRDAVRDLTVYLRDQEDYHGPEDLSGICDWLAEHDEHLGVDIFPASVDLT